MSDFKINDKVIHCREGLSVISSTTNMNDRDYFIVHSVHGDGEAIYVPVVTANNIIRKIMTPSEADELLKSLIGVQKEFNANTKQRRDAFKRRLATGDVKDIAYMFYQSVLFERDPEGVRLGAADNDMLGYAKSCLLDELSLTYDVERDKVEEFVLAKIK